MINVKCRKRLYDYAMIRVKVLSLDELFDYKFTYIRRTNGHTDIRIYCFFFKFFLFGTKE